MPSSLPVSVMFVTISIFWLYLIFIYQIMDSDENMVWSIFTSLNGFAYLKVKVASGKNKPVLWWQSSSSFSANWKWKDGPFWACYYQDVVSARQTWKAHEMRVYSPDEGKWFNLFLRGYMRFSYNSQALCSERYRDWTTKFDPLGIKCEEKNAHRSVVHWRSIGSELTGDTVHFGKGIWGDAKKASIMFVQKSDCSWLDTKWLPPRITTVCSVELSRTWKLII